MIRIQKWGRVVAASVATVLLMHSGLLAQDLQPVPSITPPSSPTPNISSPQIPPPPVAPPTGFAPTPPPSPRLQFTIDPKTPLKDLLPIAPKTKAALGPVLSDDLAKIPEIDFQAMPEDTSNQVKMIEQTAHQFAKINHLNAKKTDGFLLALLEDRTDLTGLPFAMGDDCRTTGERLKYFTHAVRIVQIAQSGGAINFTSGPEGFTTVSTNQQAQQAATPQSFWNRYTQMCDNEDANQKKSKKDYVAVTRIAALMQILAPASTEMRLGLVKYLAGVPHVEATRALAQLAIFSVEDEVHQAAVDALKVRSEKDYTDILVKGLRYPWPAVAKRAADAIARAERADLIPELLTVLEEDDPRLPKQKKGTQGNKLIVREMVKVNHNRNCAMCHSPSQSGTISANAITAPVPIPGQAIESSPSGYGRSSSLELMIRVDVTYLRQDFSVMLTVDNAHPWPEMQRFDFLVRERPVSSDEAATYTKKLTPKEEGVLSPYHKAALAALRQMTGKDTAPTAEAWRKLLKSK